MTHLEGRHGWTKLLFEEERHAIAFWLLTSHFNLERLLTEEPDTLSTPGE